MTIDDVASILDAWPSGMAARQDWMLRLGVFDSPFRKRYVHSTRRPAEWVSCPAGRDGCYQDVKLNPVSKKFGAVCSREPELCQRRTISKQDVTCWALSFERLTSDIASALGVDADCMKMGQRLWRCGECRAGGESIPVFFGTPETDGDWAVDLATLGGHSDWLLVVPSTDRLRGELAKAVKVAGGVLLSLGECCRLARGRVLAGEPALNAVQRVLAAKATAVGDTVWSNDVYEFSLNGTPTVAYGGRFGCADGITAKSVDVEYAGRIRLALEDCALQFNVIGEMPLKVRRVLRVETASTESLVEFEGGAVLAIDFVTYPDLERSEVDSVRAGKRRGPSQAMAHFRTLPLAKAENEFRKIHLPSRDVVDLSRKSKRRLFLREVWRTCLETGSAVFYYADMQERYNTNTGSKSGVQSERFRDDLFKGQTREFDEMFDTIGSPDNQEYRLRVRFE